MKQNHFRMWLFRPSKLKTFILLLMISVLIIGLVFSSKKRNCTHDSIEFITETTSSYSKMIVKERCSNCHYVFAEDDLYAKKLPVVYVYTDEEIEDKEKKIAGICSVVETDGAVTTKSVKINGRGNATWISYPKKPYKLSFSCPCPILGMKEAAHWLLLADYCDKTLLRTAIGLETSSIFGMEYVPDYRYVNLVLNNEYLGVYILTEQVEVRDHRIRVSDDGFLIEGKVYDDEDVKFCTEQGIIYHIKYPRIDWTNNNKLIPIEKTMNLFEHVLYSANEIAFDETTGYRNYIDVESWAKWFLINNVLQNLDTNYYYYKYDNSEQSMIKMGPVWDFEWSIGIGWYYGDRPNSNHELQTYNYFERLLEDDYFRSEVKRIWNENKKQLEEYLPEIIVKLSSHIYPAQQLNFRRWNILDRRISVGGIPLGSYEAELECDFQFLENHIQWLNTWVNSL